MVRILLVLGLALAGQQVVAPLPTNLPGLVEQPLPKLDRQGRLIHGGVLFHFDRPPGRGVEIGRETVVAPRDGPEGQKDHPGPEYCQRSFTEALTELATRTRDRGGDAVISIGSDPGDPKQTSSTVYLCDHGRVRLTATIISTR